MIRYAALAAIGGLALAARLLDATRLELEYRLDQRQARTGPSHGGVGFGELDARHDGGASGRYGT